MISITTDFSALLTLLNNAKEYKASINNQIKELATTLIPIIRNRVHVEGKLANGNNIGTYNDDYLKRREKRGRNEGNKVVLSFNRNLENSLKAIADRETWGIGVVGEESEEGSPIAMIELVKILEEKYGVFYGLSDEEKKQAKEFINNGLVEAFEKK